MPSDEDTSPQTINVNVELAGPEWRLQTTMSVPAEPIALKEMLPLFFSFADAVMSTAANGVEQTGEKISCKKGCGACCRQLVPISETEAHWIAGAGRSFTYSKAKLKFGTVSPRPGAGLPKPVYWKSCSIRESWGEGEGWSIAMSYFRLGIPCPFLENEACSIHQDRPVKCREYLVTSPAEHCRAPSAKTIKACRTAVSDVDGAGSPRECFTE